MSTNGGAGPGGVGGGGSKRLAQQQAQVDEVVDIMRQNVDKVLERDKNLSLLDDRADKLQHNAAQFEQHAGKLKRKFWWKNMKMMIIMGVVGTIFAIVVIGWIYSKVKAVTPAPASGDATTAIPAVNEPFTKVPVVIPSGEKLTTRRNKSTRKKTTKAATTASPTAANDDEPGSSNAEDASKTAVKQVINDLVNRQ